MTRARGWDHAFPWIVMTDGAIFPKSKVCGVVEDTEGSLRLCSVGDIVMLTGAEVEAYLADGVELVSVPDVEAAE
jgi:hypothetical protein